MARFISDQNKVIILHESGTYAQPMAGSSLWIGQVQSNTIDDEESKIESRFIGTASRSVDSFEDGPRDVTGTLSYRAQDMGIVLHAIGSVTHTSGTQNTIRASEIDTDVQQNPFVSGTNNLNPPFSFTIEDSKQAFGTGGNFIRTVNGVVPNTATITATQGEVVSVDIDWIGQTASNPPSSGTTTTVVQRTNRPYLYADATITLDGTSVTTVRDASLEINQNIAAPHYLNGSRDIGTPFPGNRDYTFNVTLDWSQADRTFYEKLYKGGSTFNATFDLNADSAAGSQHVTFVMSGCEMFKPEIPSEIEGPTETTLTIRPKNLTAVEYSGFIGSSVNPF